MWTNIPKPTAENWVDIAKPERGFVIPQGTATGLLMSPTYAVTITEQNH